MNFIERLRRSGFGDKSMTERTKQSRTLSANVIYGEGNWFWRGNEIIGPGQQPTRVGFLSQVRLGFPLAKW